MTVQVSSTEMRPARAANRTGAAERAYKKRTQRAAVHSGSAIAVSGKNRTGTLTARIPFVATILVLLAMGLAMTLLLTTRSAEDSYQLSAARAHNQSLAEEKAALERDVETANSAPKLAEEAAKLGMVPANDPARLVDQGVQQPMALPSRAAATALVSGHDPTPRIRLRGCRTPRRGTRRADRAGRARWGRAPRRCRDGPRCPAP